MAKHSQAAQRCTSAMQFGLMDTRCILSKGHPEDHHGLVQYELRWSRDDACRCSTATLPPGKMLLPVWPDAANALGIGRTKMFELVSAGTIPTVRIGRRRLVPAQELRDYVLASAGNGTEVQHQLRWSRDDASRKSVPTPSPELLPPLWPDAANPGTTGSVPDPEVRPTVSVEEAAQWLGIGRNRAYEAARRGDLPTIRIGHRLVVPTAALRCLLRLVPAAGNGTENADAHP